MFVLLYDTFFCPAAPPEKPPRLKAQVIKINLDSVFFKLLKCIKRNSFSRFSLFHVPKICIGCTHGWARPHRWQSLWHRHGPGQSCCPAQEWHHSAATGTIYHHCQGTPWFIYSLWPGAALFANLKCKDKLLESPQINFLYWFLPAVCRDGLKRSDSQRGWCVAHFTRVQQDWGTVCWTAVSYLNMHQAEFFTI